MTRTVESPRGGATLSITPDAHGIVYLKAANVVSEVTVPLRTADLLAAIADECGVIVVDRAELPEVASDGFGPRAGGETARSDDTSAALRSRVRALLAIAEHLDAREAEDQPHVERLTEALGTLPASWFLDGLTAQDVARHTVRRLRGEHQ